VLVESYQTSRFGVLNGRNVSYKKSGDEAIRCDNV